MGEIVRVVVGQGEVDVGIDHRIAGDAVVYPDIDLALADNDTDNFTHKDGTPY